MKWTGLQEKLVTYICLRDLHLDGRSWPIGFAEAATEDWLL